MSAFFMLYRIWFQIAAVVVLVGGAAYGIHKYNESLREDGRQEMRLEYNAKLVAAQEDARQKEATWRQQKETSDGNAAKRIKTISSNLATANLINSGLRGEADNLRNSLSDPTVGTTADGAAAIKTVLGECTRELESYAGKGTELATSCDRHVNDLQRYHEQWPKVEIQK